MNWKTVIMFAVGFVGGYYVVKHYHASGGRVL